VAQTRHHAGLGVLFGVAAAVLVGCGADPLVVRHPELEAIRGQRLGDANPYVLPYDGRVRFFHCRWPTDAPIDVSLPPDASEAERRAIEAALEAWEHAGLGVSFARVPEAPHGIEMRFVGGTVDTAAGQDTANTVVDCAIAPLDAQDGADVAGAALASARIRIARITNPDMQGHQRPLTEGELAGTALHELGHALGFQGHARQGDTVMVSETERVAHAGADLLRGRGFADASLRALYRLPNGAMVSDAAVDRCRTELVDRMAALAASNALAGPFLRMGETAGRVFWRDAEGREYGLVVAHVVPARRHPERLVVLPERRVRDSLARGLDTPCPAAG
jgi:hypothetical protein